MADEVKENLMELLGEPDSPFGDYIKYIANCGLRRYQDVRQTGAKEGQTLYTHVLDGVSVLEIVCGLLRLAYEEICCLFLAYSVHDINKLPGHDQKAAYRNLASPENIARELERISADEFFPDWRSYLADIVALCRLHQGHLAVDDTGLDRRDRLQYRLTWQRVERLGCLMRAVDVLDLSHDLAESKHKDTFIRELNAAADGQRFRLINHRLAENRGILTNLIHRAIAEYLHERLGAVPLLYYPEGTVYLVEEQTKIEWRALDDESVAANVERALQRVQGRALQQFIKKAQNGYRVDQAALDGGATPAEIMAMIREQIEPRLYGEKFRRGEPARREENLRRELTVALPGLDEDVQVIVERLLEGSSLLPEDDQLRVGELVQAYCNFLETHMAAQLKARKQNSWRRAYQLLDLPLTHRPIYEAVQAFRRAYFMARDTAVGLDELATRINEDLVVLGAEEATAVSGGFAAGYLRETLTFSFASQNREDFSAALERYVADQHEQCCYCGSALRTAEWMSANVPPNVGVQFFSNRLGAGGREPKRRVCPLCRTQFILEKLAWTSHRDKRGAEQATFYLHLFPYSFFTEPFLHAWRREVQSLLSEDITAAFIDTGRWLREQREERGADIHFKATKVNGLALPLAEAISNTPVMAINAPGDSYSKQLLLALQYAVILGAFFGCRLILSRTAVPIVPPEGEWILFVDGVPSALDWLVHGQARVEGGLDQPSVDRLTTRLSVLHLLHRELFDLRRKRNLMLEFARAANDNPLTVFFVADRAIEEKSGEPFRSMQITVECAPYLEQLLEVPMTQLRTLAQMAVDNSILGGSGPIARRPRNALLKPLDIVFDVMQSHPDSQREDLHAAAAEEVFSHIQRIASADYKPGAAKEEKVGQYVQQFLSGVVEEMYDGDLNRLIADERYVRSAYVWYVRQGLAARRDAHSEETAVAGSVGNNR